VQFDSLLGGRSSAFALLILSIQLASCGGVGISLKDPVAVKQQAQHSIELRFGESTRNDVHEALGEPLLQSGYWGFDLFRANDISTEIRVFFITILPIPVGVFTSPVEGYVLVAYDNAGRIAQVSTGDVSNDRFPGDFQMLRARDISFGIDKYHQRGLTLMADAARLQGYVAVRRPSGTCTVIMACDDNEYQKWPYETCPDRVAIDDAEPFDPRPFFGHCEPGRSCSPNTLNATGPLRWMQTVHPITLRPGSHRLTMSSATFKGRYETSFECAAGEVRYGIIRGNVNWHWWSPQSSTLNTAVTFTDALPGKWASHNILLYNRNGWVVEAEPESP
jgi:hypothetical protein